MSKNAAILGSVAFAVALLVGVHWCASQATDPVPSTATAQQDPQKQPGVAGAAKPIRTTNWQEYVAGLMQEQPDVLQQLATNLINEGLLKQARELLQETINKETAGNQKEPKPASPITLYLFAKTFLLEYEMGRDTVAEFDTPSEVVTKQLGFLNTARVNTRAALENLENDRTGLGGDKYAHMRNLLLTLEARILMARGDVGYRLQGPTLLGQLQGAATDSIAMAEYGIARQKLYEALLISRNVSSQSLAFDLDQRIGWLRNGRAFGGQVFFEVDPVMGTPDGEIWTPLAELENLLEEQSGSLIALQTARAKKLKDAEAQIQGKAKAFQDEIKKARGKAENRLQTIAKEIFDLQKEIDNQANTETKKALQFQLQSELVRQDLQNVFKAIQESDKGRNEMELRKLGAPMQEAFSKLGDLVSLHELNEILAEQGGTGFANFKAEMETFVAGHYCPVQLTQQ